MNLVILLITFIILFPVNLFANAGTGLVWAQFSYFTFINIIISVVESLIYYLRINSSRSLLITIVFTTIANYLSALIGTSFFYLYMHIAKINWDPLGYGDADESKLMIVFLIISFIVTIIVEGLFIIFTLFRKVETKIVIKNVVIANIVTYIILVINFWYWIIN